MRAGGSCLFPASSLTRLGRVAPTLPSRRTSKRLFLLPGCAGAKPPPPDNPFFDAIRTLIGRQRKCAFGVPFHRRLPHAAQANVFPAQRGDPAPDAMLSLPRSHVSSMSHALGGRRGFRPRLPRPVASNCSPIIVRPTSTAPSCTQPFVPSMPAAARRAVRLLVLQGAVLWCHQARRLRKPS